jgi:hypothetical protein
VDSPTRNGSTPFDRLKVAATDATLVSRVDKFFALAEVDPIEPGSTVDLGGLIVS